MQSCFLLLKITKSTSTTTTYIFQSSNVFNWKAADLCYLNGELSEYRHRLKQKKTGFQINYTDWLSTLTSNKGRIFFL